MYIGVYFILFHRVVTYFHTLLMLIDIISPLLLGGRLIESQRDNDSHGVKTLYKPQRLKSPGKKYQFWMPSIAIDECSN